MPITKKAGRVAQGEGPEFKPQYLRKEGERRVCERQREREREEKEE
jgi:hypothetical protein